MPLKALEYMAPACEWSVFRSDSLCSLLFFALPVFVFASVLTLIAISVERCVHPPSYSPSRVIQESVFSFIRQLSMWHCPRLLLSAGACCTAHCCRRVVQKSIDVSYPPGFQQQTCNSGVRRANGRTDGQTDTQPLRRPSFEYYARSVHESCIGPWTAGPRRTQAGLVLPSNESL